MRAFFSVLICFMLLFSTAVNGALANEWFEKYGIEWADSTLLEEEVKHLVPVGKKSKTDAKRIYRVKNYFSSIYIPKQDLQSSKIFNPPEQFV